MVNRLLGIKEKPWNVLFTSFYLQTNASNALVFYFLRNVAFVSILWTFYGINTFFLHPFEVSEPCFPGMILCLYIRTNTPLLDLTYVST